MSIHSINLKNFKSVREVADLRFGDINVLIGANGAGKSNLISFFKLLNNMVNQNLQVYVKSTGRANNYLYFGTKKSTFLEGEIQFFSETEEMLTNSYKFDLLPTQDGGFIFKKEVSGFNKGTTDAPQWNHKTSHLKGASESHITDSGEFRDAYLMRFFKSLKIFHFHDTSATAFVKGFGNVNDNTNLKEDAGNLAAFLFRLSRTHPKHFNIIEKTIQSVAPFFNHFNLKPTAENQSQINLTWLEKGSDDYFDANNLSDGTLRFACLATLLLQPMPPKTIIIDEPELGLHPSAIDKLAALIKSASSKTQIIISTQSVGLLNNFEANDIIVVERHDEQSTFKRLESEQLSEWLNDYSLGELWNKNVIGGRP